MVNELKDEDWRSGLTDSTGNAYAMIFRTPNDSLMNNIFIYRIMYMSV